MSFAFFSHVPFWVWCLFVALVALGLSATRTQQKPLWAALAMPLVMTGVSAYGAANTFTTHALALIAWASAVAIAVVLRSALGWWGRARWRSGVHGVMSASPALPVTRRWRRELTAVSLQRPSALVC